MNPSDIPQDFNLNDEAAFEKLKNGQEHNNADRTDSSDTLSGTPSKGKKKESDKKADDLTTPQQLMKIIDGFHFFQDTAGSAWVRINKNCYPVRSTSFKRRLQRLYFQKYRKTPYSQALQDVIDQAEGIALFDSPVEEIHVRGAKIGSYIIIDRGDGFTTIAPYGWEEGLTIDANFWRPQGLNSLPDPEDRSDGIEILRKYLNYDAEDDFRLMVSWLLAALNPEIPCPILALQGEQNSGKSTDTKVLRSLIDPAGAMINPAPREERSLVIQAQNSRVLALDNLSGVHKWLSDALCRICTGTGFSTRRLYTNDEQQIFQVKRPIILNGIDDIATRGDLLDRSIVLRLPSITPENCRDEGDFWYEFQKDIPFILNALYKAVAVGLESADPQILKKPRMADYAVWITKCEPFFKWEYGSMLAAYNRNKDNAIENGLDSDNLGGAIRQIMSSVSHWEGTATELVQKIKSASPDVDERYLPTTRTLKNRLTRLAPALRKVGITWDYKRTGSDGSRTYILDKAAYKVSEVSEPSENPLFTDTSDRTDTFNGTLSKDTQFWNDDEDKF